jgi:hypothetical protein
MYRAHSFRKVSFSRSTHTQNVNIPESTTWARDNSLIYRLGGRGALEISGGSIWKDCLVHEIFWIL